MVANKSLVAALLLAALCASSVPTVSATTAKMTISENPIRRVVNMLQAMQKKVKEEGEKSQELYDKYMCYCKKTEDELTKSIEDSSTQMNELPSAIDSIKGKQEHLKKSLAHHKEDKSSALAATAQAKEVRNKEHVAFTKEHSEENANLKAVEKAINLVSGGSSAAFLQTPAAGVLRAYLTKSGQSLDADRQGVLAFLSGQQGEEGEETDNGEIVGVLKSMADELKEDMGNTKAVEDESVENTRELLSAKKKETDALTNQIEGELMKLGDVGVNLVKMKNELEDAQKGNAEDSAFLAELKKDCAAKKAAHEKEQEMRGQEQIALSETIELLNSDDALELFKKALPSAGSSFLQLQTTAASMRSQARAIVDKARSQSRTGYSPSVGLDFVSLALNGRKAGGLDKVIAMVKGLIVTLENDQQFDDRKKEYCAKEMDVSEDQEKEEKEVVKSKKTVEDEVESGIGALKDETAALKKGIDYLDMSVKEATETRKKENAEHAAAKAANNAAKNLLIKAKNRMAKVYLQFSSSDGSDGSDALPSPPAETSKAYQSQQGGGVMNMMASLVQDLDKEMIQADMNEKHDQAAYEAAMQASKKKRFLDSQNIDDKTGSLADLDTELEDVEADIFKGERDLRTIREMLAELHAECDWLLQYYDQRKEARTEETESLKKAIGILSGADSSLVQIGSSHVRVHKFLGRQLA